MQKGVGRVCEVKFNQYSSGVQGFGQAESATKCKIVALGFGHRLCFLLRNEFEWCSAGFAEGLVAVCDLVVHDAG